MEKVAKHSSLSMGKEMYTLTEPTTTTTTTTNDDDGLILAIKYFRLLPNLCSPTQDKHNRREDNLNSALVTRRYSQN
ncbi:hypothetical protein BLOT_004092 [Blomia tropicalis]|nr:hypothetical protein BLOT_004092 [Blomia tropicalis]